jgi:hypothetical protein
MAEPFPVQRAHTITATTEQTRWLIEGLWGYNAVGILGGEPKCCKSLCALSMAVAVASGRSCLGGHRPLRTGAVLLYAAEDAPAMVRERLALLSAGLDVDLADLPIQVITATSLRLDREIDRERLDETVATHAPVLLILDPFVRLHRVDENVAGEVAPILDGLRQIQRAHGCAVLVVHHARKGAAGVRAGQALRGSSEFHAWGDSNLFLRRQQDVLTLDVEHRAACAPDPIRLSLESSDQRLVLAGERPTETARHQAAAAPEARLLEFLATATTSLTRREIQGALRMRAESIGGVLEHLQRQGSILRSAQGYRLAPVSSLPTPAAGS